MVALFDFLKKGSEDKKEILKPKKEKISVEKKEKKQEKPIIKKEIVKKVVSKKKDLRKVYKILKEPHISEKSTQLSDKRQYTFKVYNRTNKTQIKRSIEGLYGVNVKGVNIINIKSKKRVLRGIKGSKSGYKKAIITLREGEKIEILPH